MVAIKISKSNSETPCALTHEQEKVLQQKQELNFALVSQILKEASLLGMRNSSNSFNFLREKRDFFLSFLSVAQKRKRKERKSRKRKEKRKKERERERKKKEKKKERKKRKEKKLLEPWNWTREFKGKINQSRSNGKKGPTTPLLPLFRGHFKRLKTKKKHLNKWKFITKPAKFFFLKKETKKKYFLFLQIRRHH